MCEQLAYTSKLNKNANLHRAIRIWIRIVIWIIHKIHWPVPLPESHLW